MVKSCEMLRLPSGISQDKWLNGLMVNKNFKIINCKSEHQSRRLMLSSFVACKARL